jgi:hypothetical protein
MDSILLRRVLTDHNYSVIKKRKEKVEKRVKIKRKIGYIYSCKKKFETIRKG